MDADIQCLAKDLVTVKKGAANCWPFWLETASIVVGETSTKVPIKQDQFVWLTNEIVECTNPTTKTKVYGLANCKRTGKTACTAKQQTRLGIGKGSSATCIPTMTWEYAKKK